MTTPAADAAAPDDTATSAARPADDVAEAARLLAVLRAGGDARRQKVRRVRGAVRADDYENDLKLSVAVDRLFGELRG